MSNKAEDSKGDKTAAPVALPSFREQATKSGLTPRALMALMVNSPDELPTPKLTDQHWSEGVTHKVSFNLKGDQLNSMAGIARSHNMTLQRCLEAAVAQYIDQHQSD